MGGMLGMFECEMFMLRNIFTHWELFQTGTFCSNWELNLLQKIHMKCYKSLRDQSVGSLQIVKINFIIHTLRNVPTWKYPLLHGTNFSESDHLLFYLNYIYKVSLKRYHVLVGNCHDYENKLKQKYKILY